jgi:DNA replication protein DnaC
VASIRPHDPEWLADVAAAALARIDGATPVRYREPIPVPAVTRAWADGTSATEALAIVGPMGRGKTHLAWRTARLWITSQTQRPDFGKLPTFVAHRATELFDKLRPDAPDNPYAILDKAKTASLLLIDDVAAAKPSVWTQERLYELIDERYVQRRPIILTCDVPPAALGEWVGPRVASRLTEMSTVQVLDGPDHRTGGTQ